MNEKVMIHACPQRMWYVEGFLAPELRSQGAEVEIWNDVNGLGNLDSCMASFAQIRGDGDTWHLQDDVLPCRDFAERCRQYDGIVFGFCCEQFEDDPRQAGRVYLPDAWHSFQCVRIPNAIARECAEWVRSGSWEKESPDPNLPILRELNRGDDSFFRDFLLCRHPSLRVTNAKPNLVEHVDWLIGGSILSSYREYIPRAHYWDDEARIRELKELLPSIQTASVV